MIALDFSGSEVSVFGDVVEQIHTPLTPQEIRLKMSHRKSARRCHETARLGFEKARPALAPSTKKTVKRMVTLALVGKDNQSVHGGARKSRRKIRRKLRRH